MISLFKSKTGYTCVEDSDQEGQIKMEHDYQCRPNPTIIRTGFKSVLLVGFLFLSSIVSNWVLFFGSKHDARRFSHQLHQTIVPLSTTGPAWVCQRPSTRREWRTLQEAEKTDYLTAVKCLASKPSKLRNTGTLYDDFAWVHKYLTTSTASAHNAASFLPWHRYFIQIYEKALTEDCGFDEALPYWDWSQDSSNFRNAPVWDTITGLGGDGSGVQSIGDGKCLTSGPFSEIEVMFYDNEIQPHCISRGFPKDEELSEIGQLISPEIIDKLSGEDRYEDFALELEERAHKFLTHSVRGDLSRFTGPNDPVFFLHHVNLDRLWWQWQQRAPDGMTAYNGNAFNNTQEPAALTDTLDMGGLARNLQVIDVMHTTSEHFCYKY